MTREHMSSPKKSTAKNTAGKKKNPAASRAARVKNADAPQAEQTAQMPHAPEAKLPAKREAKLPARHGEKLPDTRRAQLPAEREARLPAAKTPRTPSGPSASGAGAIPLEGAPGNNPYLPAIATVTEVIRETPLIVTLRLVLDEHERMSAFSFRPGQVGQISVFGVGESTFVINSPPSCRDYLQFSVMKAGEVTAAVHQLSAGDKVGLRAPLGNSFPVEQWKGKDVFFVGGGIGMAPIRTAMLHLLDNAEDYGTISLLYGARSPRDMAYGYELEGWLQRGDLKTTLTIDAPFEGWEHKVGLIPNILLEAAPRPQNCIAVLCGPPIMIKFTLAALQKLGFPDEQIFTTLEKRMKCGIGICGRCNIGHKYVCVDGPVFSLAELKALPDEL